jgi:Calcineurin-like phosphoesterase/RTX calcium-binding nonapeptide repeat (4 copies)
VTAAAHHAVVRAGLCLAALAAVVVWLQPVGAETRVRCTLSGTPRSDRLVGTSSADVICAGAGDDMIDGRGGNDVIYGGAGNDVIYAGGGADRVVAGVGADLIFSYDMRRDIVDGGSGEDRVRRDPNLDRSNFVERQFPAAPGRDPVVIAAGDIADCGSGADRTAPLLDAFPYATVLALGDNAYPHGTIEDYDRCYSPTWGRAKARTKPTPGNHEYDTAGAAGYFNYFGGVAGNRAEGWYSFELGEWHVVSLNSNCGFVAGGCAAGSPQERWLRADLALHPRTCTLAYWHHPLFSSGGNVNHRVAPLWQALYEAHADLVLVGHEHAYERFAPQTTAGAADPERGIREIIVGTGGASHSSVLTAQPNSEARDYSTYGLLWIGLAPTGYSWNYVGVAGQGFTDTGSASCH